ncbi:MAG: hypothetical protein V7724_08275 [Sediminicola sp.]|tara:strand:+ start:1534 stop:1659 length:126 start_codon:yes stop_codon:yes gene_type:complete
MAPIGSPLIMTGTLGEINFYVDDGINVARQPMEVLMARISS